MGQWTNQSINQSCLSSKATLNVQYDEFFAFNILSTYTRPPIQICKSILSTSCRSQFFLISV